MLMELVSGVPKFPVPLPGSTTNELGESAVIIRLSTSTSGLPSPLKSALAICGPMLLGCRAPAVRPLFVNQRVDKSAVAASHQNLKHGDGSYVVAAFGVNSSRARSQHDIRIAVAIDIGDGHLHVVRQRGVAGPA